MRNSRVFGFLFAGFTVTGMSAAGCTTSSNSAPGSALGESCTRTADCQSPLVCLANVCAAAGRMVQPAGPDAAGDTNTMEAGVEASGQAGLSGIGETCQTTRDCGPGLACVPTSGGASVCDVVSYGVTPAGKTCSGECSAAADCCALPTGLGIGGINDAGVFVNVLNCTDILLVLLGGDASICASQPAPGTSKANACFYYQTYCSCAANTWACSSGRCIYAASCQASVANTLGGCPSFTRTLSALNSTCDMPGNKCHAASSGCSTDANCDGLPVSDEPGVVCRGGDCACYMSTCYLKCAKDLDCKSGYTCDATKKLCAPSPCSNDAECFSRLGKARARCNSGACGIPCTVDRDCSPSGDIAGQTFNGTVCGPAGVCVPVGCTSDADCAGTSGARLFCVTAAMSNVHSAVTN